MPEVTRGGGGGLLKKTKDIIRGPLLTCGQKYAKYAGAYSEDSTGTNIDK